jgi:hypothetical protein
VDEYEAEQKKQESNPDGWQRFYDIANCVKVIDIDPAGMFMCGNCGSDWDDAMALCCVKCESPERVVRPKSVGVHVLDSRHVTKQMRDCAMGKHEHPENYQGPFSLLMPDKPALVVHVCKHCKCLYVEET